MQAFFGYRTDIWWVIAQDLISIYCFSFYIYRKVILFTLAFYIEKLDICRGRDHASACPDRFFCSTW